MYVYHKMITKDIISLHIPPFPHALCSMLEMVVVCYSIFPEHFVLNIILKEHLKDYDGLRNIS